VVVIDVRQRLFRAVLDPDILKLVFDCFTAQHALLVKVGVLRKIGQRMKLNVNSQLDLGSLISEDWLNTLTLSGI
jgi:hypothetical protein